MFDRGYFMYKAYKYRIYPNQEQCEKIEKTFDACRFVYNHYLKIQIDLYKQGKRVMSVIDCLKHLEELKNKEVWLSEVSSQALFCSLCNLNIDFQKFLEIHTNFPNFKSKEKYIQSYNTVGYIHHLGKYIEIPMLGFVETEDELVPEGRSLSVTISKETNGKYYVSLYYTDVEVKSLPLTEEELPLGIGKLRVVSDDKAGENQIRFEHNSDQPLRAA